MKLSFSGQNSLILGASCEPGLALALKMIHARLHPILTYRNKSGLDSIKSGLCGVVDGAYTTCRLRFNDWNSLDALFGQMPWSLDFMVDFIHGDYEALVASADDAEICRYFDENVSFRTAVIKRAARRMLQQRRGRMIYISSAAAARPNPGQGFYAAAKLASEALYRNLGLELGSRGITTVTLRPGYVDSGRGKRFLETGPLSLRKKTAVKPITPAELADTVMFYLSDHACGCNAMEIAVDGGFSPGKRLSEP